MNKGIMTRTERFIGRTVNVCLVALALGAWAAAKAPEFRLEITVSAVCLSVIISSILLILRKRDFFDRSDIDFTGRSNSKSPEFKALETSLLANTVGADVRVIGAVLSSKSNWRKVAEAEPAKRSLVFLAKNDLFQDQWHRQTGINEHYSMRTLSSGAEDYAVKVGNVMVEVKGGVATIKVGAPKTAGSDDDNKAVGVSRLRLPVVHSTVH